VSAVLRVLITNYRQEPSPRPDGTTHVRDDAGITHSIEYDEDDNPFSSCGRQVSYNEEGFSSLEGMPRGGSSTLLPTWDDIDCMACVAAETAT
jgi:hypothetical protein